MTGVQAKTPLLESRILKFETEREEDGRWIAEVSALPGVLAYGKSKAPSARKSAGVGASRDR